MVKATTELKESLDALVKLTEHEPKAPEPRPASFVLAIVAAVGLSLFALAALGCILALELVQDSVPTGFWIIEMIALAALAMIALATGIRVAVDRRRAEPKPEKQA